MKTATPGILTQNLNLLNKLNPYELWVHFLTLCATPRGSCNEKALAEIIIKLAEENNLQARVDPINNVVVYVPATKGFEHKPSICLQAHLDMVCEKNPDVDEIFPIELILEGERLKAKGTTLGADNGISVAGMMAIMSNHEKLQHGALELLFTTVEETGMLGAKKFNYGWLKSKLLLNLDSEEEGILYVGCAGGARINGAFNIERVMPDTESYDQYEIILTGLTGGHSGTEIHLKRANAIIIMALILEKLQGLGLRIINFTGGTSMNSIPREAKAMILIPSKNTELFYGMLHPFFKDVIKSYSEEIQYNLIKIKSDAVEPVLDIYDQKNLLQAIRTLPNGVLAVEPSDESLVRTSNNISMLEMNTDTALITMLARSSSALSLEHLERGIESTLLSNSVADFSVENKYMPWEPRFEGEFLDSVISVYTKTISKPKISTIHAGLECAVFAQEIPCVEIVSVGPEMGNVHSPEEWVNVKSVERFWNFLIDFLKS